MIKAVLFDLDGVLTIDSKGSITTCKYLSKKMGIDFDLLMATNKKWDGELMNGEVTYSDIWKEFCEYVGKTIDFNFLHKAFISAPIDKKMEALAFELKKKYKIGLVTDNTSERARAVINKNNWNDLFDVVCISAEVGCDKKSAGGFLKTLTALGVAAEECVFIDNSAKNLVVPGEMGMKTILFDDEKRCFKEIEEAVRE